MKFILSIVCVILSVSIYAQESICTIEKAKQLAIREAGQYSKKLKIKTITSSRRTDIKEYTFIFQAEMLKKDSPDGRILTGDLLIGLMRVNQKNCKLINYTGRSFIVFNKPEKINL